MPDAIPAILATETKQGLRSRILPTPTCSAPSLHSQKGCGFLPLAPQQVQPPYQMHERKGNSRARILSSETSRQISGPSAEMLASRFEGHVMGLLSAGAIGRPATELYPGTSRILATLLRQSGIAFPGGKICFSRHSNAVCMVRRSRGAVWPLPSVRQRQRQVHNSPLNSRPRKRWPPCRAAS